MPIIGLFSLERILRHFRFSVSVDEMYGVLIKGFRGLMEKYFIKDSNGIHFPSFTRLHSSVDSGLGCIPESLIKLCSFSGAQKDRSIPCCLRGNK